MTEVTYYADTGQTRHGYVVDRIKKDSKLLEIGGSYNPMFRRDDGYNIFTADHDTQDNLYKKYTRYFPTTAEADRIQPVDFVATDGNLDLAIEDEHAGTFDFCLSSHNIEHIPNPIAHIKSIERLLAPGGAFLMAVPDKRGCFDLLRPMTTTGEWIAAYQEPNPFHSRRHRFDYEGMAVGTPRGVTFDQGQKIADFVIAAGIPVNTSYENISTPATTYTDMHAWTFTPHSMMLILRELNAIGLIGLYPHALISDGNGEFLVDLVRCGPIPVTNKERLRLLARAIHEQAEAQLAKIDMSQFA